MADAIDVLEGAEELIDLGWCRGDLHKAIRGGDHYCLLGGVRYSHNGSAAAKRKAVEELWLTLYEEDKVAWVSSYYARLDDVVAFNDESITKWYPLALISKTLDRLRADPRYRHHRR